MTAPSRDDVFAALRAQGIRPIKVVSKDPLPEPRKGVKKRVVAAVSLAVALIAGVTSWMLATRVTSRQTPAAIDPSADPAPAPGVSRISVSSPVVSIAQPLPRQRIPGNRARLEAAPKDLFKHPLESYLARFAEPGRKPADMALTPEIEANAPQALKEQILIASDELTEYIDLKRIVTGMKRELRLYLAAGGTIKDYAAELIKRQKLEISYREKAESRLQELVSAKPDEQKTTQALNAEAYDYWLKANASLQAMGIAPLPIPEELRAYQLSLEIDEFD